MFIGGWSLGCHWQILALADMLTIYGQAAECYLTFMTGEFYIVRLYPHIDHKTSLITISNVPWRIPVREAYWKEALSSYDEQARAYRISCEINRNLRDSPIHK